MQSLRSWRSFSAPFLRICRRSYSESSSSLPPLPPPEEWSKTFDVTNTNRDRACVKNPETARLLANSFLGDTSSVGGEGKIVIETFPGPGALSRALLELPRSKIRKLIILEDHPEYLQHLKVLEKADSRVQVVPYSGHVWDTYSYLEDAGLLSDVQIWPWESGLHPNLHFISHLQRSVKGEQLIAQLFRCIPDRTWLYKFGRVPMSFVMSEWVWTRIASSPSKQTRCKLSVIAEATAQCRYAMDRALLQPYETHFHPVVMRSSSKKSPVRKVGYPFVALNIIPHADQIIDKGLLEKWDYCLRRLFVLKGTPLKRAISSLAPGASSLLKTLTDPSLPPEQRLNPNVPPRGLTVADWALIVRAFDQWPFAPEDLLVHDGFDTRQGSNNMVVI
ncbi:S-adenosyl-L-methionine-dependent methyltransferase [Daedalea quercina L-15889]|uniref:rRNA adenine N(6)-methyltransferase n=1 Tax=Daedalea quercina L-15889 TaxID=1314783 RepID=A0A165RQM7_9APHY|nr:S-adenosyl-L-methionine-dependent methyltransferase [Daedalea quercina L-15889]